MNLRKAIDFHGHLGPYLVLGLLIGDLAIKKLKCKKHFGMKAIVKGATKKPKSCLIDGIQISTGCTFGKGNIEKVEGNSIRVFFKNLKTSKKMTISLKKNLVNKLDNLIGHNDSEVFARRLLKINSAELFRLNFLILPCTFAFLLFNFNFLIV